MAAFRLLVTSLFISSAAAGLSDFSNDLVTDLAPLLAMFGDSMTKQFFSESVSLLDYIFFITAPIEF
jgi:hypothetical protein